MREIDKSFVNKFKLNELTIKNVGSWIISLRPQQPTLGSLILTLNRKCELLSQITENEGMQLSNSFTEIEKMYKSTFKPDKINYLALMMIDNQVHFHVIPRYGKKILFDNQEFEDHKWPVPPSLESINLENTQLLKLLEFFKGCDLNP
jgi:diadenosine tetraphosphate (Ap4A) HIT family hydrolase